MSACQVIILTLQKGVVAFKFFPKLIFATILGVFLLGITFVGRWGANLFTYTNLDPDGAYMSISVHHLVQGVFVLMVMLVLKRFFKVPFAFGLGDRAVGWRYLKRFMLMFVVYAVVAMVATVLAGGFQPFPYPLSVRNITGYLGFQLLLSGPSEELIFRAFAITTFAHLVTDKRLNRFLSYAAVFAAVIFGLAHVVIRFNPFSVDFHVVQLVYAAVLGCFYGDCYEKSKSVVYPMIMHSFTNVVMVVMTIVLSVFL